jgi:hypothetical protein
MLVKFILVSEVIRAVDIGVCAQAESIDIKSAL